MMDSPRGLRRIPERVAQIVLTCVGGLRRRWPSVFDGGLTRSSWIRAAFRAFTGDGGLLEYRFDGVALRCYPRHWASLSLGAYEPITRRVIESLLQPGMVFVDGGANVGLYSLVASRRVGPRGLVYAFEPHPDVRRVLLSNLERNRLCNVRVYEMALGESRATAKLHFAAEPGSHTLLGEDAAPGCPVPVVALDDIVHAEPVDVIKLDLEGSEPAALRGMTRILGRTLRPAIVMEYCSEWLDRARIPRLEVIGFLESRGYTVKVIEEEQHRGPLDLDDSERERVARGEFTYTLVCLPERAVGNFRAKPIR